MTSGKNNGRFCQKYAKTLIDHWVGKSVLPFSKNAEPFKTKINNQDHVTVNLHDSAVLMCDLSLS